MDMDCLPKAIFLLLPADLAAAGRKGHLGRRSPVMRPHGSTCGLSPTLGCMKPIGFSWLAIDIDFDGFRGLQTLTHRP